MFSLFCHHNHSRDTGRGEARLQVHYDGDLRFNSMFRTPDVSQARSHLPRFVKGMKTGTAERSVEVFFQKSRNDSKQRTPLPLIPDQRVAVPESFRESKSSLISSVS